MAAPYIPATDVGFRDWLVNFDALTAVNFAAYGITSGQATDITNVTAAYVAALTAATDPSTRTPATIAAKNTAKADALVLVRPIAQQIKANPAVTDEQRAELGLVIDKFPPTPVPAPLTFPLLDILNATPGIHTIQYRDSETPFSKAKPPGALLMELWQAVGTAPAPDPTTAAFVRSETKCPFQVAQLPENAGKIATYFARWVTRTGLVGPWSSGVSLTIAF